jgi:hypothetical protein
MLLPLTVAFILARPNPDRRLTIAGAVGAGLVVGGLAWWFFQKKAEAGRGKVICSSYPYPGGLVVGDYVVVQLGTSDGLMSEPTWAKVLSTSGGSANVELVGETGPDGEPVPLSTARHGFALGQKLTIKIACIFDRFRPGQPWHVLCGPALVSLGDAPIPRNRASLLSVGDNARVVVRASSGATEPLWTTIESVSSGQQTLRATIVDIPELTDHGLQEGDPIEFLRDCVIAAEFT